LSRKLAKNCVRHQVCQTDTTQKTTAEITKSVTQFHVFLTALNVLAVVRECAFYEF